jgi:hypothetical protein
MTDLFSSTGQLARPLALVLFRMAGEFRYARLAAM